MARSKPRRRLLGRFDLDAQVRSEFDRSGLLDLVFSRQWPDAQALSLDGNRSIARLAPAGSIVSVLVQDYCDAVGTRSISFEFGELEIVNDGAQLAVFFVVPNTV